MGPAEIVASLKELCADKGPRLTTEQIVAWIEAENGFETEAELIAFAKKMKARQYARMLECEDEETGMRIKRLWSFHDRSLGRRFYADILDLPARPPPPPDPPVRAVRQTAPDDPPRHGRLLRRPAVLRLLSRRDRGGRRGQQSFEAETALISAERLTHGS